jgi:hypothetical protein
VKEIRKIRRIEGRERKKQRIKKEPDFQISRRVEEIPGLKEAGD